MKVLFGATLFVASVVVLGSSSEAAVSFYLGGSNGTASSYEYSSNSGIQVGATGHYVGESSPGKVARSYLGLGVKNSSNDNTSQIDGSGRDDFLRLAFNQVVKLLSITFAYVDGNDDFDLTVDGTQVRNEVDITSQGRRSGPTWTVPINVTGKTFDIGADGSRDDFVVKRVKVETTGNDVVPEPTTALMWSLFGLGILMLRRRRQAA